MQVERDWIYAENGAALDANKVVAYRNHPNNDEWVVVTLNSGAELVFELGLIAFAELVGATWEES